MENNSKKRWQRMLAYITGLASITFLAYTQFLMPEIYAALFVTLIGLFTYQKKQEHNGGTNA